MWLSNDAERSPARRGRGAVPKIRTGHLRTPPPRPKFCYSCNRFSTSRAPQELPAVSSCAPGGAAAPPPPNWDSSELPVNHRRHGCSNLAHPTSCVAVCRGRADGRSCCKGPSARSDYANEQSGWPSGVRCSGPFRGRHSTF